LECLQKSLRIASSCIDELTSVQLYVDALDRYIYYFEQGVEAVTPKYVNSLVELITSNIDSIHGGDVHPSSQSPPGLVDGVNAPDMIVKVGKRLNLLPLLLTYPVAFPEYSGLHGCQTETAC